MPLIELNFAVTGTEIPADHGYALYGALSRVAPIIHDEKMPLRIGPIRGSFVGNGKLRLDEGRSQLRVRLRPKDLPALLPLAGNKFDLAGCSVRLGTPQVRALVPATTLFARLVVIKASSPRMDPTNKKSRDKEKTKRYLDPAEFVAAIKRDMERRGIGADADLPVHETGPRTGEPCHRELRVKDKRIVGFSVIVQGLTAEESVKLQEEGLGGRGKMGCGFFVPRRG